MSSGTTSMKKNHLTCEKSIEKYHVNIQLANYLSESIELFVIDTMIEIGFGYFWQIIEYND